MKRKERYDLKNSCTAERLRTLMNARGLKQVDIVKLCQPYCNRFGVKMNKSDISQYLSGKTEPSQDKLIVLGMALDVQESWLMGFDVPAARSAETKKELAISDELSPTKRELQEFVSDMSESEAAVLLASLKSALGKL